MHFAEQVLTLSDKADIKKRDGLSKPIRTVVEEEEFIVEVSNSEIND